MFMIQNNSIPSTQAHKINGCPTKILKHDLSTCTVTYITKFVLSIIDFQATFRANYASLVHYTKTQSRQPLTKTNRVPRTLQQTFRYGQITRRLSSLEVCMQMLFTIYVISVWPSSCHIPPTRSYFIFLSKILIISNEVSMPKSQFLEFQQFICNEIIFLESPGEYWWYDDSYCSRTRNTGYQDSQVCWPVQWY